MPYSTCYIGNNRLGIGYYGKQRERERERERVREGERERGREGRG